MNFSEDDIRRVMGGNVLRVLQLGAAGFVPKSMASETLVSAIRFVLSGGFYIPGDLLEEAQRLGIFGAPSFVSADGELFWGNDRLERALAWATNGR